MPCLQPFRDDSAQLLLFKIASCLEAGGGGGGTVTAAQIIAALGCTPACEGDVVNSFNARVGDVVLTLADVSTVADARYVLKAGDTMTGALVHPVGTAALPSITFTGDLDTGIYHPAANTVGLSAGGGLIFAVSTTGVNLTTALAYQYNSVNVVRAQTALSNYFFGPSGNLTMTGVGNSSIGNGAFTSNTTGFSNVAVGTNSLNANTTGGNNLAIGVSTLQLNISGDNNVAVGVLSLFNNLSGSNNTAIGQESLRANTTGIQNVAIGTSALLANTTGLNNVALGVESLQTNSTSSQNVGIGVRALQMATSGSNTAIGYQSLINITTGTQNTAIGVSVGSGITTGSNNVLIGGNIAGLAAALSNNIIIADGAGVIRLQIDSSGNTTLAGTVATAAGTAALPAFSFTGDPNTGLYNIGADSVGLSTGGTLRTTTNTTDLILATAFRLAFASGANTRAGNAVLVGGTVTVANTSVTANTIVLLTRKTSGGTIGFAVTYTVIAATSFTLTSDNVLDTSTYSYVLIENP